MLILFPSLLDELVLGFPVNPLVKFYIPASTELEAVLAFGLASMFENIIYSRRVLFSLYFSSFIGSDSAASSSERINR